MDPAVEIGWGQVDPVGPDPGVAGRVEEDARRQAQGRGQGGLNNASGTIRGTQLHVTSTVSVPVGRVAMSRGAARAPRMPLTPAAVSTRPMCTGLVPAWMSRSTAMKIVALTVKLTRGGHSSRTHWGDHSSTSLT